MQDHYHWIVLPENYHCLFGLVAMVSAVSFMKVYQSADIAGKKPTYISIGCNTPGSFLTEFVDGSVRCATEANSTLDTLFAIQDVNDALPTNGGGVKDDLGLSETLYQGVFTKLITSNIFASFIEGHFAAVVFLQ
jgi:hypothetical protein